ncbi:MAG TPA: disulfide bond formation protein DsbA [Cellvibrio sp.]|nr:disulfide bond formation protein DsbA [Cellvibrio sp.]
MNALSRISAIFIVAIAYSSNAQNLSNTDYIEGKDYSILSEPVRVSDPSKIEVAEAFAYPCHACFNFEPLLEVWVKGQSTDVKFVRSHVSFRSEWLPYQRGYYTLLSLNLNKNIDMDIFNEIHIKHSEMNNAQSWANFLSAYGVEKQKVINAYDSFGVDSQIKQADARNNGYKITSTPTLVVDGRYKVSNNQKSYEESLKVAQFLVNKVRKEKNASPKSVP